MRGMGEERLEGRVHQLRDKGRVGMVGVEGSLGVGRGVEDRVW